jgi:hypothetical protein
MGCRPEVLTGLGSSFPGFFMDQVLILYFVAMMVANPSLYLLCSYNAAASHPHAEPESSCNLDKYYIAHE